jgi:hypothetical protein
MSSEIRKPIRPPQSPYRDAQIRSNCAENANQYLGTMTRDLLELADWLQGGEQAKTFTPRVAISKS